MQNIDDVTMNMLSINIERFTSLIKEQMEDGDTTPILGMGPSGIGKTECAAQVAHDLGVGFKEIRLVHMTETDLMGVPTLDENNHTKFSISSSLPFVETDGERGILVLDEITSASKTVRAAAYQLLDAKRSIGDYHLPDGWLVVVLGNGEEDGGTYVGMENAFLNRCRGYRVMPDFAVWKRWGYNKNVNNSIISFLNFDLSFFHKMGDPTSPAMFPSPRSWKLLSDKINKKEEKKGGVIEDEEVQIYAGGCIGAEAASVFAAFYAFNKTKIDPLDILAGRAPKDANTLEKLGAQALMLSIGGAVKHLSNNMKVINKIEDISAELYTQISNAVSFFCAAGEVRLDYVRQAFADVNKISPIFADVVTSDRFDEDCPEFGAMSDRYEM